jgi:hypothetical protein
MDELIKEQEKIIEGLELDIANYQKQGNLQRVKAKKKELAITIKFLNQLKGV